MNPDDARNSAVTNNSTEVGFVTGIQNFLLTLEGLPSIRINDLIENEDGSRAYVTTLLKDQVLALLLDETNIRPGQLFTKSKSSLKIPVGDFLIGRVINPLGVAIDGKGLFLGSRPKKYLELKNQAPGIKDRKFITNQLETGITLIDMLIPIGKGQRELIVGEPRSGKTSFLINLIANQKYTNTLCIYAAIGKPITEIRNLIDIFQSNKVMSNTIIIAASSSDPAPLIFLTPETAFAVAEHFQKQGKDVVVILDDLGIHAKIHREISLLSNKIPGRESYPGDIFYQHSHLVERAGNFKPEVGGGTITALPVIEINLNDFSSYIPTNLMSMTDGHLLFKSGLYNQGQRPAVDLLLSVSRVGQQTQFFSQKIVVSRIKSLLTQAEQTQTLTQFSGELSESSKLIHYQSQLIQILIKQDTLTFIPRQTQIALLALVFSPFLINKDISFLNTNKSKIIKILIESPDLSAISQQLLQCNSEQQLEDIMQSLFNKVEQVWPQ